jgi:hypothetical protein
MSSQDPTRREFLKKIARGAAYAAPVITTFAVAPDLLGQATSLPGHMHTHSPPAPATPAETPGPAPSDKHPPPSKKNG